MSGDAAQDDLASLLDWHGTVLRGVELLEEIDSTNAEALRRSDQGVRADGRVLLARRQLAGHGSRGRRWEAPPGRSLALTAWLPWPATQPWALATWAGAVAVVDAAAALAIAATLKWPNDVLIAGRKVAGVLAELRQPTQGGAAASGEPALALGIGVNVLQREDELPRDPPTPATSLALAGASTTLTTTARTLLAALDRRLDEARTAPARLRDAFLHALRLDGALVVATLPAGAFAARLTALAIDGTVQLDPPGAQPPLANLPALPARQVVHGAHVSGMVAREAWRAPIVPRG